jgi:5'(3')-deoxyribonucleotidase
MKTLLIDIDNTIGNLIGHYLSTYNLKYNSCIDTNIEKFDKWGFPEFTHSYNKSSSFEEEKEKMINIFNSSGFWETLPLLPNSDKVLKFLNKKYDIYLVTSPSFESPFFFTERIKWVKNNLSFFDYKKLIFCKNKSLFKSNYILIDDYPENLLNFEGKTIKINYKFNEHVNSTENFNPYDWKLVPNLLKKLNENYL